MELIICLEGFLLIFFPKFSLLINHNFNVRNDHNNTINVLPQLVVPSILFKFSRTKAK
jgi:hypothetical protein